MDIFQSSYKGIPLELNERLVSLIVECQNDSTVGKDMYEEAANNIMAQYELTPTQEELLQKKISEGWKSITDTRDIRDNLENSK